MKKIILTLAITFMATLSYAQIKIHESGHISLGTLTTGECGVHIKPSHFVWFKSGAEDHGWAQMSNSDYYPHSKHFIVAFPTLWDHMFYVLGNGEVYGRGFFSSKKGDRSNTPIENPISKLTKLNGYYYSDDEYIPSIEGTDAAGKSIAEYRAELQNNENVKKEAVEELIKDKYKKSCGFDAIEVEKTFPEAVRTTAEGEKAISYNDILVLCVEAIKEQQKKIEYLEKLLENQPANPQE